MWWCEFGSQEHVCACVSIWSWLQHHFREHCVSDILFDLQLYFLLRSSDRWTIQRLLATLLLVKNTNCLQRMKKKNLGWLQLKPSPSTSRLLSTHSFVLTILGDTHPRFFLKNSHFQIVEMREHLIPSNIAFLKRRQAAAKAQET